MYLHECLCVCACVWCLTQVFTLALGLGLGRLAKASLLAAAGECQQMWIVKRSVWFISCSSTCTKHSCCLAHRAEGNVSICVCVCVCVSVWVHECSGHIHVCRRACASQARPCGCRDEAVSEHILMSSCFPPHSHLSVVLDPVFPSL